MSSPVAPLLRTLPVHFALLLPLSARLENGRLEAGDDTLNSGEFRDAFTFEAEAGETVEVDLQSSDFDPYLIVSGPGQARWENDDWENRKDRSHLVLEIEAAGTYAVVVTSYKAGETGAYRLRLPDERRGRTPAPTPNQRIQGELSASDATLDSGEYYDTYSFAGRAGQTIVLDLTSSAFDPYLILRSPSGDQQENDDHEGDSGRSHLETELTESGAFEVVVTSYKGGETGAYELLMPSTNESASGGGLVRGTLEGTDSVLSSGEYCDRYTFEGEAGASIVVDLSSHDFDPYLIVQAPSGDKLQNDDFEGSSERSRVDWTLPESGTYTVFVTSYKAEESGDYELRLPASAPSSAQPTEAAAHTRRVSDRLGEGDSTLGTGEYVHNHYFTARAGTPFVIDLTSEDFDPYLILTSPSGVQSENDDHEGSSNRSRLEGVLPENGQYRVAVTTYKPGEAGAYRLEYPVDGTLGAQVRQERGRLEEGDETLSSGEYSDTYEIQGIAGQRLVADLRSSDFDPYLMVRGPDKFAQDNDDHEGSSERSRLSLELPADGTYRVIATTYKAGSSGAYELVLTQGEEQAENLAWKREGTLAEGDLELDGGEYADTVLLSLTPGTRLIVDLVSTAFDPYVALRSPSGEVFYNDDFEGSAEHSRLEHEVNEAGEYAIFITSYKAGETGAYTMTAETDQPGSPETSQDLDTIALGQSLKGRLAEGDLTLDAGEYADVYAFEGHAGEAIAVELSSSTLDTYLVVMMPDGRSVQNDDAEGDAHRSFIELPLEEDGRYRIVATSYAAAETGDYTLRLGRGSSDLVASATNTGTGGGIYGIFVGISDYGGRANNLSYTDEDARRVFQAMREGPGMPADHGTLLIDSDATRSHFEDAIARLARTAGEDDTVVIFFSGHGGRYDRPTGFDHSDPDGKDESLEFYDSALLDDDLNDLLGTIHAGTQLIVVDACFSGGLAKDIISHPGRMGLFSSEEDVTSAVAAKFRAGGYLSVFFRDGLVEPYADADENGELSALELSHYISERYRAQVKGGMDDWVSTGQNLGYQKLVVDRGSIRPYDTLFRRN